MEEGLAEKLYKKVPVNIRSLGASVAGDKSQITENDFSEKELQYIQQLYLNKTKKNDDNLEKYKERLASYNGKTEGLQWERKDGELVDTSSQMLDKIKKAIKSYENTKNTTSIDYEDYTNYTPENAGWYTQLKNSFSDDPSHRIKTTLGRFKVVKNKDGSLVAVDNYNWNKTKNKTSTAETVKGLADSLLEPEKLANGLIRTFSPEIDREVYIRLPAVHQ